MSTNIEDIADWQIVFEGGYALLGRLKHGGMSPVYHLEGALNVSGDPSSPGRARVQSLMRCSPVLGMVSITFLLVSPHSPAIDVRSLSREEQLRVHQAVRQCDEIVQQLRAQQAGILVASSMPKGGR